MLEAPILDSATLQVKMRISELSRVTGVPVATVKFYLREGLLPSGRPTAATRAEYDETHVRRLRLVRALAEVGGLPLSAVRDVLKAVDGGPDVSPTAVARAHDALPPAVRREAPPVEARALVADLGWAVRPEASALYRLQAALDALAAVGRPAPSAHLRRYAEAALDVARADMSGTPPSEPSDLVEFVVVGTVLYEPLLLALRRLAHQHLFVSRRAGGPVAAGPPQTAAEHGEGPRP
jgi:DNA-binding transcriptional MerR regulator